MLMWPSEKMSLTPRVTTSVLSSLTLRTPRASEQPRPKQPKDQQTSLVHLQCTLRTIKLLHHTSTRRACRCIFKDKPIPTTGCVPSCEWKTLIHPHRHRKRGSFLRKWSRFFFLKEVSSDKNFEQQLRGGGVWGKEVRSKACKFLMNRTNEPRGPRRGGEKGASFLN